MLFVTIFFIALFLIGIPVYWKYGSLKNRE